MTKTMYTNGTTKKIYCPVTPARVSCQTLTIQLTRRSFESYIETRLVKSRANYAQLALLIQVEVILLSSLQILQNQTPHRELKGQALISLTLRTST